MVNIPYLEIGGMFALSLIILTCISVHGVGPEGYVMMPMG
jgi:hypothetical protein